MEITVTTRRTIEARWAPDRAYDLVADVPRSASHFPGLVGLDDHGGGTYGWRLSAFAVGGITFATRFASRYAADPATRTVRWTPVPVEGGNTKTSGEWRVVPDGTGSKLHFENTATVDLPLPKLMGGVVRKVAQELNDRQVDGYLAALARTVEGVVRR